MWDLKQPTELTCTSQSPRITYWIITSTWAGIYSWWTFTCRACAVTICTCLKAFTGASTTTFTYTLDTITTFILNAACWERLCAFALTVSAIGLFITILSTHLSSARFLKLLALACTYPIWDNAIVPRCKPCTCRVYKISTCTNSTLASFHIHIIWFLALI